MTPTIMKLTTLPNDFLAAFNRHQEVSQIYYLDKDKTLQIKDEAYIEAWDNEKKAQVIDILRYYLSLGGVVLALVDQTRWLALLD